MARTILACHTKRLQKHFGQMELLHEDMKLLLSGATGFVGRNFLLSALKQKKYSEIIIPVRNPRKLESQLAFEGLTLPIKGLTVIEAEAPLWNFQLDEVDHVVHSAGLLFAQTQEEYFATNVEGTRKLFERIRKVGSAVVLSSQSATGPTLRGDYKTEKEADGPLTFYGESKLAMEKCLREEFSGLNYLCLRPPMILGARDTTTLPLFKMAKCPVQFKPGLQTKWFSFIDVQDLVKAIETALCQSEKWSGILQRYLYLSASKEVSDENLIQEATRALGKGNLVVKIPQTIVRGISFGVNIIPKWRETIPSLSVDRAKEIWPNRWVISSKAFQETFHWVSGVSLASSLRETADWYRRTGQI